MKNMSKSFLALVLIATLGACNSDDGNRNDRAELRCETPTAVNPPINQEFNVQVGDTVTADNDLQLQFVAVDSDSRCATDVQCISAGSAVLSLRGQAYDREAKNFKLETGADTSETFEFGDGFYQLELISVAPAPLSTQAIAADGYCATFRVMKALQ